MLHLNQPAHSNLWSPYPAIDSCVFSDHQSINQLFYTIGPLKTLIHMLFSINTWLHKIYTLKLDWKCATNGNWEQVYTLGFPSGSDGKESACNVGDSLLIPESWRCPGEENGNPPVTLAWRIPWTEEPVVLQSMWS